MKRATLLLLLLVILVPCFIFASGEDPEEPIEIEGLYLGDRIRNVPAVVSATDMAPKIFVSTFGLNPPSEDGDEIATFKIPKIVRFRLLNSINAIQCIDYAELEMIEDQAGPGNGWGHLNCYTDDEHNDMLLNIPDICDAKYQSGVGFWSSPVYCDLGGGNEYLVTLNKSGLLMLLNPSFNNFADGLYDSIDLRAEELQYFSEDAPTYLLEYASTPCVIGNTIYIAGLHCLFKVNIAAGDLTLQTVNPVSGLTCTNNCAECFWTPVVWDCGHHDEIYFSVMTRDFIGDDSNVVMFNASFSSVQVIGNDKLYPKGAPCFDASGYLYFPGHDLQRFSRKTRTTSAGGFIFEEIDNILTDDLPGLLMSDFSSNLVSQGNVGSAYRISEIERDYDYCVTDPIFEETAIFHPLEGMIDGYSDNNNYGIMFEDMEHNYSMLAAIGNTSVSDPNPVEGEDIPLFYNDYIPGFFIIELTRFDHGFDDNDIEKYVYKEGFTYGGLAPYKTNESNINAIFGADTGYLYSWKHHLPAEAVRYPFQLDVGEPIISNINNSKFQRDVTNNCSYTWADNCVINVLDVDEGIDIARIFANGYTRGANPVVDEDAFYANFDRIPAHPNYTVGFSYVIMENGEEIVVSRKIKHVEMYNQEVIYLPFSLDLVVHRDETFTISQDDIVYNSIRIELGGKLIIAASGVQTDILDINNGAELEILNNASLHANTCECINENSVTPIPYSLINVNASGYFTISTMSLNHYSSYNDAWCILIGDADNTMTVSNLYLNGVEEGHGPVNTRLDVGNVTAQNESAIILAVSNLYNYGNIYIENTLEVRREMYHFFHAVLEVESGGCFNASLNYDHPTDQVDLNMKFDGEGDIDHFKVKYGAELILDRADFDTGNFQPKIEICGDMYLINGSQCDLWSGTLLLEGGSHLYLSGGSLLEISCDTDDFPYRTASLQLNSHVCITGDEADDQIVIKDGGKLISDDDETFIHNVAINSSSTSRWGGITYSSDGAELLFLINWYVEKINALDFNDLNGCDFDVKLLNCHIDDCKYGVKTDGINSLRINASSFENCTYGAYADRVGDVQLYVGQYEGNPANAYMDNNQYGIVIKDADAGQAEKINNYWFENNEVAISYRNSYMNIGGNYTYGAYHSEGSCNFFGNDVAIEGSIYGVDQESVIMDCWFEINEYEALYLFDQRVRIYNNDFKFNGRNAIWSYKGQFQQMKDNYFENNGGAEIIGTYGVFRSMTGGNNTLIDAEYDFFPIPDPPDLWSASQMDRFLLARLDSNIFDVADVSGNTIPHNDPARFYPSISSFDFGDGLLSDPKSLYYFGVDEYKDGSYTSAEFTFSNLVTNYPESSYSVSALIYFLYIESETDQDYEALRARLDALVSEDYPDLYKEKEYVVTQSYLYEEKYLDVIERLEDTIASPNTKMDSIVALTTQGYCYVQLAEEGTRALPPKCTVKTETYEEYLEYMRDLRLTLNGKVETSQAPAYTFSLDANYPNPFNPTTTISYSIPKDNKVELKVYNIKGQLVKTLVKDQLEAGTHKAVWNGDNDTGKRVSSGVYLYRLESGGRAKVRKMLLLK